MKEPKQKTCIVCKVPFTPSNSLQRVCQYKCQIEYKNSLSTTIKKIKPIKKVSSKMAIELRKYKGIRTDFLKRWPLCKANLQGCTRLSTQIHHKKGRIGELLTDSTHFLAVCHSCHHYIETHPLEAKELNLSLERY